MARLVAGAAKPITGNTVNTRAHAHNRKKRVIAESSSFVTDWR